MTQKVKDLAVKPKDMSSIPRTYNAERQTSTSCTYTGGGGRDDGRERDRGGGNKKIIIDWDSSNPSPGCLKILTIEKCSPTWLPLA